MRSPVFVSFLQSVGLTAYAALVASVMTNIGKVASEPKSPLLGLTAFLMLFVFSATVCASIVFGYPAYLVKEGKMKTAIRIVAYTVTWLGAFLAAFFGYLLLNGR